MRLLATIITMLVLLILSPEMVEASTGDRIVRIGKQYLGTPYSRMDCSEFTSEVYARAVGVYMPADYRAQRRYGYEPRHKRRGDLMLYRNHVAIWFGHGKILHSSRYFGKVVISEAKYLDPIGVRRIR